MFVITRSVPRRSPLPCYVFYYPEFCYLSSKVPIHYTRRAKRQQHYALLSFEFLSVVIQVQCRVATVHQDRWTDVDRGLVRPFAWKCSSDLLARCSPLSRLYLLPIRTWTYRHPSFLHCSFSSWKINPSTVQSKAAPQFTWVIRKAEMCQTK